jgi:hypothetical protein
VKICVLSVDFQLPASRPHMHFRSFVFLLPSKSRISSYQLLGRTWILEVLCRFELLSSSMSCFSSSFETLERLVNPLAKYMTAVMVGRFSSASFANRVLLFLRSMTFGCQKHGKADVPCVICWILNDSTGVVEVIKQLDFSRSEVDKTSPLLLWSLISRLYTLKLTYLI